MAITVELLDALLSPAPASALGGASPRQQAEAHLQTLSAPDRARGLLSLLLQLSGSQPPHAGRIMMACVLLRRDIANLGGNGDIGLLKEMVEPTLSLFANLQCCRRQVGHCVAEICASLSILSAPDSDETVAAILTRISEACGKADVESLRLLASMAERAPIPLWRSAQTIPNTILAALQVLQSTNSVEIAEALCDAIVNLGIAGQVATSGISDASTLLLGATDRPESLKLDPGSPVTQLGSNCLPPLLEVLSRSLDESMSDALCKCMQHLSHGASACPSLLAGDVNTFAALVRCCMLLACNHGDSTVRLACLEVLASICQVDDVKRGRLSPSSQEGLQLRNMLLLGEGLGQDAKGVIRICAEVLVTGVDNDVEAWAADPATLVDDAGWDLDDDAMYAESLMQLFLHNVGGGVNSLPVVLPLVETLLADTQWTHHRAGLSILECCLHAAPVTFAQHVPVAMETALKFSSSDSVRVHYQAMNLLGVLCEADSAIGAPVRQQYGSRILDAASILVQSQCTKVSAVACLAIVSYCRGGDRSGSGNGESLVVPYLEQVLSALVSGPLSWDVNPDGVVAVKVRAIGAVACLAEAAGEAFLPFYRRVMPGLIGCAQLQPSTASNGHELSILRGSSMEAATIVGQAIGESNRNIFVGDAEQIMKLAIPALSDDSAMIPMDQLLAACARIACVMGEAYSPFVGSVLPHLISRAAEPADVSITDGNEASFEASKRGEYEIDDDEGTESMTVALPGKGLKKVTINTTKIQERSLACRALYEHAAALGAAFGPHAEATLDAFMPLVTFPYSSEVRSTAAQALSAVFESSCLFEGESLQTPQKYLSSLTKSLSSQIANEETNDQEVLFALADSLSEIYYSVYSRSKDAKAKANLIAGLSFQEASNSVKLLMQSLSACLTRRSKIIRTMQGYDGALTGEDELEEYKEMLQSEQNLLTPLVDSVGYTLKLFEENFTPIFDAVVAPVLGPQLGSRGSSDIRARLAAVCLFDDCVEHCGRAAAAKHAPALAEGVISGIDNQDSELRVVSVYGIAQIARNAPKEVLAPHAQSIIDKLFTICNVRKNEADDVTLLEYSVSALGSLTLYGNAPFGNIKVRDSIAKTFLNHLPILEDYDEAKVCHEGLCEMIEKKHFNVVAEASALLRAIGDILACVADGNDVVTPATCSRLTDALFKMQRDVPADEMNHAFSCMPVQSQSVISSAMEHHHHRTTCSNVVTP